MERAKQEESERERKVKESRAKKLCSRSPNIGHVHIESREGNGFGQKEVVLRTNVSAGAYSQFQYRCFLIVFTKKLHFYVSSLYFFFPK
jgi:hypothetical protein